MFHRQWKGVGEYQPSGKEIAGAERLIAEHGFELVSSALPRLVKLLREEWPKCRTFKGVETYLHEALVPVRERERREDQRRREREAQEAERRNLEDAARRDADLEARWLRLSAEDQQEIQSAALTGHPPDLESPPK
jgi:hypothetical protein